MPVQYPELVNRRLVPEEPGSEILIVELGETIIQYDTPLEIKDIRVISSELAGKPWLISKIEYGTEDYGITLALFNGYANPFSVDEGDIVLIPTLESIQRAYRDNNLMRREVGQGDADPFSEITRERRNSKLTGALN